MSSASTAVFDKNATEILKIYEKEGEGRKIISQTRKRTALSMSDDVVDVDLEDGDIAAAAPIPPAKKPCTEMIVESNNQMHHCSSSSSSSSSPQQTAATLGKLFAAPLLQFHLGKIGMDNILYALVSSEDSSLVRSFFNDAAIGDGSFASFLSPKQKWPLDETFLKCCTHKNLTEELKKIMKIMIDAGAMSSEQSRRLGSQPGSWRQPGGVLLGMSLEMIKFLIEFEIGFDFSGALDTVIDRCDPKEPGRFDFKSKHRPIMSERHSGICSYLVESGTCKPTMDNLIRLVPKLRDENEYHVNLFKLMFNKLGGSTPSYSNLMLLHTLVKECQLKLVRFLMAEPLNFKMLHYSKSIGGRTQHPVYNMLRYGHSELIEIFVQLGMFVDPQYWSVTSWEEEYIAELPEESAAYVRKMVKTMM